MLAQRIFSIAWGYENLHDQQTMRNDLALQTAVEWELVEDCPSVWPSTTLPARESCESKDIGSIVEGSGRHISEISQQAANGNHLKFNATDDPIDGRRADWFFHGDYSHYCLLPLYVFCGEHMLCAYLWPGNIDVTKHS